MKLRTSDFTIHMTLHNISSKIRKTKLLYTEIGEDGKDKVWVQLRHGQLDLFWQNAEELAITYHVFHSQSNPWNRIAQFQEQFIVEKIE